MCFAIAAGGTFVANAVLVGVLLCGVLDVGLGSLDKWVILHAVKCALVLDGEKTVSVGDLFVVLRSMLRIIAALLRREQQISSL